MGESRDPVEVRRLLQRDVDTFIAVERHTQASDYAAAESGQSGESAARRWTASQIPAASGMRPIGRISERHMRAWRRLAPSVIHPRTRTPKVSRLPYRHADGTTHLQLDPLELIEKLCVLEPPPRGPTCCCAKRQLDREPLSADSQAHSATVRHQIRTCDQPRKGAVPVPESP